MQSETLMPRERSNSEHWEAPVKAALKTQYRFGYSARQMRGKFQAERLWKDTGKRQVVKLPIECRRDCDREVLNALKGINATLTRDFLSKGQLD